MLRQNPGVGSWRMGDGAPSSPSHPRPIPTNLTRPAQFSHPTLPPDPDTIVPTLYDPEDFAALYHADKDQAIALVTAMTEPQRVRQALAYAAWLDHHGLEINLDTVLAAWEAP